MLRNVYRKMIAKKKNKIAKIEKRKTIFFEWIAIIRKRKLYKRIKWSKAQKLEFNNFWVGNYGKKISNRWHKLYQSINGCFNPKYIPEIFYSTKIEPKLNSFFYARELSDKSLIELLLSKKLEEMVCVPDTIFVVSNGLIYNNERELISKETANELLHREIAVVIKPTIGSSSGEGVEIFNSSSDIGFTIEGLLQKYNNNFIVQRKIKPNVELATIYSKSINTIRITTYVLKDKVYHCPISLRLGSGGSQVDNIHAGGLGLFIDDEGNLAEEAYRLGYGDTAEKYKVHPDTGIVFKGYKLSFMKKIISVAESLHGCFPGIGIISWDMTVDYEGRITIIEANLVGQGIWLPQIISKKSLFEDNTDEILRILRNE